MFSEAKNKKKVGGKDFLYSNIRTDERGQGENEGERDRKIERERAQQEELVLPHNQRIGNVNILIFKFNLNSREKF